VSRIFDLRKMAAGAQKEIASGGVVNSVQFDQYGHYLLSGSGKGVRITAFANKQWEDTYVNEGLHDGVVNIARISQSGRVIVTGGEDRFMKLLSI